MDQRGIGIYITIWPRPDYVGQEWSFEFIPPSGSAIVHTLKYTGSYPYDWIYDGWVQIDEPYPGCFRNNFYGRFTGFTEITNCTTAKDGNWALRFKEGNVVKKEWHFILKPIDRGTITIELEEGVSSILPDGLEEEPNTSAGGDYIDVHVNFKTCQGAIKNQSVYLSNKFVNGTGGHTHNEPVECISSISRDLYSYCGNFSQWDLTTDQNGNAQSVFTAPYYSGEVEIKAKSYYKTYQREHSKKLEIKVPNLIKAGSNIGYQLFSDNKICIHGDLVHYYNKNALTNFSNLAIWWYYSEYNPNYKILKFTAGSLPWGGKFDDGECWSSHSSENHHYHRQGLDCDISTSYTDGTKIDQQKFNSFVIRNGFSTCDFNDYHTHVRSSISCKK